MLKLEIENIIEECLSNSTEIFLPIPRDPRYRSSILKSSFLKTTQAFCRNIGSKPDLTIITGEADEPVPNS